MSILAILTGITLAFNYDLLDAIEKSFNWFSDYLFGGKRLAPNETKFNS